MTILSLDPSTDVTGIALVRFGSGQEPVILYHGAIQADRRQDRWTRIRQTRRQLSWVVHNLGAAFDSVAYEVPFVRGQAATAALHQAVGAYLSLSVFAGFEALPVMPNSAKAALSCSRFLPHYDSASKRAAGRARGKELVIEAINQRFGLNLSSEQDADADAIAVGLAAHRILVERQRQGEAKRAQGSLKLRTRRKAKEPVSQETTRRTPPQKPGNRPQLGSGRDL